MAALVLTWEAVVTWACFSCVSTGGKQELSMVAGAWLGSSLACVSHCSGNTLCPLRHAPLPGPGAKKTKAPCAKAPSLICKSLFSFFLVSSRVLWPSLRAWAGTIHQFFTDEFGDQVSLASLVSETVSGLKFKCPLIYWWLILPSTCTHVCAQTCAHVFTTTYAWSLSERVNMCEN